jgi:hypothetical protein
MPTSAYGYMADFSANHVVISFMESERYFLFIESIGGFSVSLILIFKNSAI